MGNIMDKLPRQIKAKDPEAEREKVLSRMQQDDFLLKQIDEFREKAKQLQTILVTKENKVDELQEYWRSGKNRQGSSSRRWKTSRRKQTCLSVAYSSR